MRIDADNNYEHAEYGEVLVQGVHQQYSTYDTDDRTGVEAGVYVRFARSWDGYGALFGETEVVSLDEFVAAAGEKFREFDRVSTPAETSDT